MQKITAALVILLTAIAATAEPSEYAKKFLAKFKQMNVEEAAKLDAKIATTETQIKQVQSDLALVKAGKIEPLQQTGMKEVNGKKVWVFKTKKDQQDKIDFHSKDAIALQKQIDTMQQKKAKLAEAKAPEMSPLSLEVGYVGYLTRGGYRSHAKVISVAGEASLLVGIIGIDTVLFLEGIPTAGIVDGKEIKLERIYEVAKTKEYVAASGAKKTVFVLIPADDER